MFVNHGGGPLPLLGKQPTITKHLQEARAKFLPPQKPKSIVVLSAHWESDPIQISSSPNPSMYYDYGGFPPETYKYQYNAPGNPELAQKIQGLLSNSGLDSHLNAKRGYDHGVFVPLMIMFPEADVPVVSVSLHSSLSPEVNMKIGQALAPLRDEGILILGSGQTFHNFSMLFNPTASSYQKSTEFNDWLKDTLLHHTGDALWDKLRHWEKAPSARQSHPREEHLIPLFMVAAAAGSEASPQLIYDAGAGDGMHATSAFLFQ